jgi:hypothetical protein
LLRPWKLLFAAVAVVLALFIVARAPGAAQETRPPFSAGEKLRYEVRWRLVPAGQAEITLSREDGPQGRWKALAKANSVGYVSNIFKVEDEYNSIFRRPNFCSSEIRKVINEGERHREESLVFDDRRRLALFESRDRRPEPDPPVREQSAIPSCVYDILSALYYVRSQPLTVGQSFEIPVHDGPRNTHVRFEVQAREEINTPMRRFQTIRVEPDVFSGNLFKAKGRMQVWFSDDASRLPVQLRVQIGTVQGTIVALLKNVEHAENP